MKRITDEAMHKIAGSKFGVSLSGRLQMPKQGELIQDAMEGIADAQLAADKKAEADWLDTWLNADVDKGGAFDPDLFDHIAELREVSKND